MSARHPLKKKLIEVTEHDAVIIRHALAKNLKNIMMEIQLLKLTRERDLTQEERWMLPANLQLLTRERLKEQIDPWITLQQVTEDWIKEFRVEDPETLPKIREE